MEKHLSPQDKFQIWHPPTLSKTVRFKGSVQSRDSTTWNSWLDWPKAGYPRWWEKVIKIKRITSVPQFVSISHDISVKRWPHTLQHYKNAKTSKRFHFPLKILHCKVNTSWNCNCNCIHNIPTRSFHIASLLIVRCSFSSLVIPIGRYDNNSAKAKTFHFFTFSPLCYNYCFAFHSYHTHT